MICFRNDSVEVKLTNNVTAIFLTWQGFAHGTEYREGLEESLEIAEKHQISHWISDIRRMEVLDVSDQEWAGQEWLPKAVSAGCYKFQAVIMNADFFGDISDLNMTTKIQNQPVEFRHFTNLEDAKRWLKNVG